MATNLMADANSCERVHSLSVSFDYEGHERLDDLSGAMKCFSDALAAYAKRRSASLRIVRLEAGSLQCHLEANHQAWIAMKVMADDIRQLESGKESTLMPEAAKRSLRKVLDHVSALHIGIEGTVCVLRESASTLLETERASLARDQVSHTGVLDQVDLKANAFRILLPHGDRVTCMPALPFVDTLSLSLRDQNTRLKVIGDGKFGRAGFLPSSIHAARVEVVYRKAGVLELLESIRSEADVESLKEALSRYNVRFEAVMHGFAEGDE